MEEIDGDAPAQQQQLRKRQRPPVVFTNTLLANSVSQVVTALIGTVRFGVTLRSDMSG